MHTCEWHPARACSAPVVALVDGCASYGKMPDGTSRASRYLCAGHLARIQRAVPAVRVLERFEASQ